MDTPLDQLNLPATSASTIDRVRYLIKLTRRTQAQFSALIGIAPSNLAKILSGRAPVTEGFLNRVVVNLKVSKQWLVDGSDVPFPRGEHGDVVNSGAKATAAGAGAPVYDVDATAGAVAFCESFTDERIIGHLDLPGLDPANPVLHVRGDSMVPRINNGSYISIRKINPGAPIFWGQIYVVVLDEYVMVKFLRRHTDPDKLILHSEIDREQVRDLYLVERILNYDILN